MEANEYKRVWANETAKIQQLQDDKVELEILKDKLLLALMYTKEYENLTIEVLRKKFGIKHQDSTKEG